MKKLLVLLCAALIAVTGPIRTLAESLPLHIEDAQWQPLADRIDRTLQSNLESGMRAAGWTRLLERRELAVALVDLSSPARPRFARINGSTMMYAASLPKIAILLAAEDALQRGQLQLDAQLDQDLHDMIRSSSNSAATRTIDRLGGLDAVNAVLTDPRFGLYDRRNGGGLWVGKRYAKSGRRVPDPVHGISHGATATQVARFYYRLATGRLINPQASAHMLAYMAEPAIAHKFVNTLQQEAPAADLYRKSGTWKNWHADSVLVWGPEWRRYILVGLVEHEDGERILRELVEVAETALRQRATGRLLQLAQ